MLTREQDETIERLALASGRVHVSSYADGSARATIPSGVEYLINPSGTVRSTGYNHSIDWSKLDG